jgi:hypothetical protein
MVNILGLGSKQEKGRILCNYSHSKQGKKNPQNFTYNLSQIIMHTMFFVYE